MFDVLIIGCGNIAGGFDAVRPTDALPLTHAGAYTRDGRFRLAACVDPDETRRAAFAERWKIPLSVASLGELAYRQFDVVSITSPTPLHAEHLDAALALHPRLIFCDKPVTPDATETRRWVDRTATAGVLLAVNHTRRWAPDLVELANALRAGMHGAIRSATGCYAKGILNNGGHMIDLLDMLLGPVSVRAVGQATYDFWNDDPTIPAMLDAGGVPVMLSTGDARDYARFELEIVTQAGVIAMEDGGQAWRVRHAQESAAFKGYYALDAGSSAIGRYDEAMTAAVANIHGALTDGERLASDGATALAAQIVCERIRQLSESLQ